ncbi:MAG: TetR family transcriptional regulator [Alphaproteobacteria bacterium PA4]|nr:MAG: TetR family transcriptional regulator [Alphaproteobacteria bacterium PA4]
MTASAPQPARTGYRRGAETRERILAVALSAFGLRGFDAVSTREIAEAARVNLPAIQYYFGSKQGLYRACAGHIVDRYVAAALPTSRAAETVLSGGDAAAARQSLSDVMLALAQFLMRTGDAQGAALFIQRELADPGAGFDILFEQLWRPGVELVGQLISAARSTPGAGPARLEAIHLISGLTAFASGRAAIDRLLPPGADLAADLCRLVERQIAALVQPR